MNSLRFPPLDPFQLLNSLVNQGRYPVLFWSQSTQGWRRILAFDPIDRHHGTHGALEFVDRHVANLVAVALEYEAFLGETKSGSSSKITEASDAAVILQAYQNYIEFAQEGAVLHFSAEGFPALVRSLQADAETMEMKTPDAFQPGFEYHLAIGVELAAYQKGFERILQYIKAGDIYQINFTHPLHGTTTLPPHTLFTELIRQNPSDFALFWETPDRTLHSLSPELFVHVKEREITTRPIKGTRPRGSTPEEDRRSREELLSSEKEQAELFMIVDLLRNDLGKICTTGSVEVIQPKVCTAQPSVWHTHATIIGQLREEISTMDAVFSMFPGGSITGCPKRRAMEIIAELETEPRGIYTGVLGQILPGGEATMNIAIRTMEQRGQSLRLGVGGGITIDSVLEEEYSETLAKAKAFLNLNPQSPTIR